MANTHTKVIIQMTESAHIVEIHNGDKRITTRAYDARREWKSAQDHAHALANVLGCDWEKVVA